MSKVRRIDFVPDEYIAGVGGVLAADEQGIYWMICALIASHGDGVEADYRRIGRLCCTRPGKVKKVVERLVETYHKLTVNDGKLYQKRAVNEVERAQNRITKASENGAKGGRPSNHNKGLGKAPGLSGEKLTTNHQPPTTNDQPEEGPPTPGVYGEAFERAWAVYPKRAGSNSKKAAAKAFSARLKEGHSAESMIDGVIRYAAFIRATGKEHTDKLKMASTFFGADDPPAFTMEWLPPKNGHGRGEGEVWDSLKTAAREADRRELEGSL